MVKYKNILNYKVLLILIIGIFISCENLNTDLPETNVNTYISGNNVVFPKGTKAIDIYNTIVFLFPNPDQYYSVTNGKFSYTRNPINNSTINESSTGLAYITESRTINGIKHIYTVHGPEINEHIVYFDLPASTITLTDTTTPTIMPADISIFFKWQRQTTNIWQNDEIGKTAYGMTVQMKNDGEIYNQNITTIPVEIRFTK
ncbi:hypothetical protein AGMMS50268_21140 [Spirochaetia bacterium]|nr:hypothetical protein AGMMS50268_21140 [Spirochaetia bacterium]